MSNKLRSQVRKVLTEIIKSTFNNECPFLLGNESDSFDWYERGSKKVSTNLFKEGLIKTYPFDFAVQRLGKYGVVKLISNKIYLGLNKEFFKDIEGIVKYINTLGYFPATFKVLDKDKKVSPENYKIIKKIEDVLKTIDNTQQVWVEIEARYDEEVNNRSQFLYHLTLKKHLNKITQQGLVPRSNSKKSYHPSRIYVVDDVRFLGELLVQFSEIEGKNLSDYVILKIDYKLAGSPKMYNDPNFLTLGYYLISNVPPSAIIETIEATEVLRKK